MPEIPEELLDEIEDAHESIDAYILAVRTEVESYIRSLISDFQEAESEDEGFAILARFSFNALPTELRRRVSSLRRIYRRQQRVLARRVEFTAEDARINQQYVSGEINSIRFEIEAGLSKASSTLALSLVNAERVLVNADELIDDNVKGRLNNIATAVVTGLAAYRSSVSLAKAGRNARFLYVGIRDSKNRPFCADILSRDKVWTRAEINRLDNHPDAGRLPVRLYAGGWNCRHEWVKQR